MTEGEDQLPPSWTTAPLALLIARGGVFIDGDWVESKDQDPDGDVRLIQLADIGDGEFRDRSARFLTSAKAFDLRCTFLEAGDVLVARMPDPLGRCCIFPLADGSRYVTVVDVCIVRPGSDLIDPKFLMFAINSNPVRSRIAALQSGSTRKRISRGNLATVRIPLAPIREQHRIVGKIEELFSELDKTVESLTLARAQLKTYRQALLKAAFEGQLTADWRAANPDKLEPPKSLLTRIRAEREVRYKQALVDWQTALADRRAGGEAGRKPTTPVRPAEFSAVSASDTRPVLPTGWIWCLVEGLLAEPLSNGRSVKDKAGGFPVLRLTAFRSGRLNLAEFKEGDWSSEEAEAWIVQEGDFFAARGNGSKHLVGIGALAIGVSQDVAYPDTMIRIAIDPDTVDRQYFSLVWNSRIIREQIESAARTTAGIYKINQPHICRFAFPLPPFQEQQAILLRILPVLSGVDHQEYEIDTALAKTNALRQSILKQAFSGQLVPQDPADEPAAALLARLRDEAPPARTRRRKTA